MMLLIGLLMVSCSFAQGNEPPNIVDFSEVSTGKIALNAPNDVKASTDGFQLQCKASGTPPLTFTWKHNGNIIFRQRGISFNRVNDNEEVLWIRSTSTRDDGHYQCLVKNQHGRTFSPKIPVRVTFANFFEQTASFVKKLDVVLGQSLRLLCPKQADSGSKDFGVAHFWGGKKADRLARFKATESRALLPIGNFLFSHLTQEDINDIGKLPNGNVQCVITAGNLIYFSHQLNLNVLKKDIKRFGPEFQDVTQDQPKKQEQAIQGKSKKMFCAAVGLPAPKITWYRLSADKNRETKIEHGKNGYTLKDFGRQLYITAVSKVQHEGLYSCKASNGVGPDVTATTELQVFAPPSWINKPPKEVSIPIESDKAFMCEAFGSPPLYYQWYHNASEFTSDDELGPRIMVDGKQLKFKNMQYKDQGVFQCAVENVYGMIVSSTWVKVKSSKPDIKDFGPFYLFKGTTATLKCESDAAPSARNTWFHNGTKKEFKGRFLLEASGSLVINEVDYSDAGQYRCIAQNSIGKDGAETQATVYAKTSMSKKPPENVTMDLGETVVLPCEAEADKSLKGTLKYKWLKDNAPLTYNDRIKWDKDNNNLIISKTELKDGAKYKCVAYTDGKKYSEDTATSTANIKGVPYPPYDLKITDCRNQTVAITWKKAADKVSPTTKFIIEQESTYAPEEWKVLAEIKDPSSRKYVMKPTLWADLTFRMRAVNEKGPSRASEPTPKGKCVTKKGLPSTFPLNLRGIPGKAGELDIAWTAMSKLDSNAPGLVYMVYYAKTEPSDEPFQSVIIKDTSKERFSIPNAGYHTKWKFKIAALNEIGQGPVSDIQEEFSGQDAPKEKPVNVKVSEISARSAEVSWKRVEVDRGTIDGYKIYFWEKSGSNEKRKRRAIPSSASVVTELSSPDETQTAKVSGLSPKTKYILAVKAFNSGGDGPSSEEQSFETKKDSLSAPKKPVNSPKRKKPFVVTCNKGNIEIALELSKFGGGNLKTEGATLKDKSCKAKRLNDTHVFMETPLDGCGTYHNYSSDGRYIIYYNHVILQRKSSEKSVIITRDHDAVFEFECRYHRTTVMSVVNFSPARATVYTSIENFGNFTYTMRTFKSDQYKEAYIKYPIILTTNQKMFVQAEVMANDTDLVLLVEKCTATPSKNRNDKKSHVLLDKGCSKDETLKYKHSLSPVQRFNFRAFYFQENKAAKIHLHCTVRVCRKADKDSRCAKGCSSSRLKRASHNAEDNEITGTLSVGPIEWKTEQKTGRSTASVKRSIVVQIVVGILGLFVVALLVSLGIVLKRQRPSKEGISLIVKENNEL